MLVDVNINILIYKKELNINFTISNYILKMIF